MWMLKNRVSSRGHPSASPPPQAKMEVQVMATLVQIALLLYLYLWHRTCLAVHHPWERWVVGKRSSFQHPMAVWLDPPRNPICAFGKSAIKGATLLLLLRAAVWNFTRQKWLPPEAWLFLYLAGMVVALAMNLNAFLYILPAFYIEWTLVAPY